MIRMIQSKSADQAKSYFKEALSKADYYINDQELQGRFEGRLAARLGIVGAADKSTFFSLSDNISPITGKALTPRTKEDRTVGYDINFHAPKSLSIVHALSNDNHLLQVFEEAVKTTMTEIEADSMTRVRKRGSYEDRKTGELVYASFTHQTARPVQWQLPDPHLHTHCFVFNATWDKEEKRIKAGQFREINRDMPYYQARFQKRLTDKLIDLGYEVKRTKSAFEIVGVPQSAIELFSKRTDQIGRVAKEMGITDAKALGELGAKTRASKQKGMSMAELKAAWRDQIRDNPGHHQGNAGTIIRHKENVQPVKVAYVKDCVDFSTKHHFERASVSAERKLLETAFRHSIGERHISIEAIEKSFNSDSEIIKVAERGRTLCTKVNVLAEERHMVRLARSGQNKLKPLYTKTPKIELKGPQGAAIEYLLTTPHRVSLVRGAAGAGKTTMMKELTSHIKNAGSTVTLLAPTAEASRGVLASEGFVDANTVAKFLTDKKMQESIVSGTLLVDEAGLLGTTDTVSLLKIVEEKNARIIYIGDTRQHSSVVRGDAMRILNIVANIKAAEVNQIRRQKDERYKSAVEDLSKGKVAEAFEKLIDMNVIKAVDPLNSAEQLAGDYVAVIRSKKSALIVSPTHKEGANVTRAIRQKLLDEKLLGKKELVTSKLDNRDLTEAEKSDPRNYIVNDKIRFNQNVPKISRGSLWTINKIENDNITIINDKGHELPLPVKKPRTFDVFVQKQLSLRKGDKVRITRNGFDLNEKRLNNGQPLDIIAVNKKGEITLRSQDGRTSYQLTGEYGHIDHAYCTTSHSSQGKTVDHVLIAQPSATFTATDAKQFYVSVSRGRDNVTIYTDDMDELLINASRLGERQSAMELVNNRQDKHIEHVLNHERSKQISQPAKVRPYIHQLKPNLDQDYEPGI